MAGPRLHHTNDRKVAAMPTHYVEDYEQVTGRKPDGSPLHADAAVTEAGPVAEAKVVAAPTSVKVKPAKVAQVK